MADVRTFRFLPLERVIHGLGAVERLPAELERLDARKVTLLSSRSLARVGLLERVRGLVGDRLASVYAEFTQHTPSREVMEAATIARAGQTDVLVSLGGGSVIDGTKAVAQCLEDGFLTSDQLFGRAPAGATGKAVPHVAIPTTLSAAEYAGGAGVTEESGPFKHSLGRAGLVPRVVILDGELSRHTPPWLWAATGMRAVDHAVESITSPDDQLASTVLAQEALRLLLAHLREASEHPEDVGLRQRCLEAAWLSYFAPGAVRMGLSHALGRRIGARFNVPHGHTSALTLAQVMRGLADREPARLRPVAEALGTATVADDRVAALAAADAVERLALDLGLPTRLSDVGIGEADIAWIAQDTGDTPAALVALRAAL